MPLVYQGQYDKYAHESLDNLRTEQFRSRHERQDSYLVATNQSCRPEELAAMLVDRQFVEYILFSEEWHGNYELKERQRWAKSIDLRKGEVDGRCSSGVADEPQAPVENRNEHRSA
jgi:hypothetical protein